jgi:2-polyprenyl-3-methyl-5-hydroxy-6-metoxy-1,4-benzoquinol methylase
MTVTDEPQQTTEPEGGDVDAFVERLFNAVLGAQEVQAAVLGHKLGWYQALAEGGALTSTELAERTSTHERYAREWLEHQAVCGYLTVDDAGASATERRFTLPSAHAEVLTAVESLNYVLPLASFVAGVGKHIDAVEAAYRTGGGVSWAELGADPREAQAAANRPMFVHQLGQEYLASIPDIDAALRDGGRVADIGSGGGWSSVGVALAYPEATVVGYDVDGPSVEMARRVAEEAGVADRVSFHQVDGGEIEAEPYDLVMALECIHDMSDPVGVLATMRSLAGSDGTVIVMDENVAETFTAPGDEVERIMYGYSLMCCLPDGMSHQPSEATGTVMRPSTLEGYARRAGFDSVEILPIENDFFRFYRLV